MTAATLHDICEAARPARCHVCPGPCTCEPDGVHMDRVAHAWIDGLIDRAEFAAVVHHTVIFTRLTIIKDTEIML